jgi:hypothetical protein
MKEPSVRRQVLTDTTEDDDSDDEQEESPDKSEEEVPLSEDEKAAANLFQYLGGKLPRAFEKAAERLGVRISYPMDATATFAMWSAANVNGYQAIRIAQYLSHHFGFSLVCGGVKIKRQLLEHAVVQPTSGVYWNGKERVDWMVSDPCDLLLGHLLTMMNRQSTRIKLHSVDVLLSVDHGKGFSRAHLVFIARKEDDEGNFSELTEVFSLGSANCATDSYPILEGTFMPLVNKGMEKLEEFGGFDVWKRRQFKQDEDDDTPKKDKYYVTFAGNSQEDASDILLYGNTTINVMSSGDLAQLMTNLGRDKYDRNWCYWCDLS